jgi:CBS domain-containing protein
MITEGDRIAGIFTERDALVRVLAKAVDPETTRVDAVMTPNPQTVEADVPVGHALHLMYEGGFRHVPVVEDGRPVGMISARDALGPELAAFEDELQQRVAIAERL